MKRMLILIAFAMMGMVMKRVFLLVFFSGILCAHGTIISHNDLIDLTLQACVSPNIFLDHAYTNEVIGYRSTCTNAEMRCAADLSLAICLMYRMDNDGDCIGSDYCHEWHQSLVSNILATSELDSRSWIRYGAGVEYMCGLNYDSRFSEGYVVATNMLAQLATDPVNMEATNFWNGMMLLRGNEGLTPQMAFQLNAAMELAEQKRWSEVADYTNSLPVSAIETFLDYLEK